MAPREWRLPETRTTRRLTTVAEVQSRASVPTNQENLYRVVCAAMRLLQDRQAHTPEEMLDPRERKVLRQLRSAVRHVVNGEEGAAG